MTLPEPVAEIDVDSATQADIATWIVNNERYTNALRGKLIEIANFFKHEELSK